MTTSFFILKNIFRYICTAIFLGTVVFFMIKFLSLDQSVFLAILLFCMDAITTVICTRKGFFEKNPLYMTLRKRLSFTKSLIVSGIVYVSFFGVMYLSGILFEAFVISAVVNCYGMISNSVTIIQNPPLYKNDRRLHQ